MGYGLIHVKGKKMELIQMGVLHLSKLGSHELKLKRIFERTLQLVDEYKPDEFAVEAPFFGKNVQSMLKLGRAQGVAMSAALYRDVSVFIGQYLSSHLWQLGAVYILLACKLLFTIQFFDQIIH